MTALIDRFRAKHGLSQDAPAGIHTSASTQIRSARDNELLIVTATANTAAVDLMDEVVLPEGCELGPDGQPAYLSASKAIHLNHDYYELPIGTVRNCALRSGKWVCQFSVHGKTETSRDVQALLEMGDESPLRGVSIGYVRNGYG